MHAGLESGVSSGYVVLRVLGGSDPGLHDVVCEGQFIGCCWRWEEV